MSTHKKRQPKGTPQGGQFAASARSEQLNRQELLDSARLPDYDDYEIAANDALLVAGIYGLKVASYDPFNGGEITFEGGSELKDIEQAHMAHELANELDWAIVRQGGHREIGFAAWQQRTGGTQLWSTRLDGEETQAALAKLEALFPDDFNDDKLHYWANCDPEGMNDCFAFSRPAEAWNEISEAVAEASPTAAARLAVAEQIASLVKAEFISEAEYVGSDQ